MTYAAEVLTDTPSGYWRLGEDSGTVASDSSGNARHGTYLGTLTRVATGALLPAEDDGAISGFAASGTKYVDLPATANPNVLAPFAMECIAKSTSNSATNTFPICMGRVAGTNPGNTIMAINYVSGRYGYFAKRDDGTTIQPTYTGKQYEDGLWHHLLLQRIADGTMQLWADGVLILTGTMPAGTYTFDSLAVGLRHSSTLVNVYLGSVDEAAIYAHELTSARIIAHYRAIRGLDAPAQAMASSFDLTTTAPRVLAKGGVALDSSFDAAGHGFTTARGAAAMDSSMDAAGRGVTLIRGGANMSSSMDVVGAGAALIPGGASAALGMDLTVQRGVVMVGAVPVALAMNLDAAGIGERIIGARPGRLIASYDSPELQVVRGDPGLSVDVADPRVSVEVQP